MQFSFQVFYFWWTYRVRFKLYSTSRLAEFIPSPAVLLHINFEILCSLSQEAPLNYMMQYVTGLYNSKMAISAKALNLQLVLQQPARKQHSCSTNIF